MSRRSLLPVAMALLLYAAVPVRADEFKPGYLQLTQLDQETYDVLWKIPAIDESTTLKVKPQFPDGTVTPTELSLGGYGRQQQHHHGRRATQSSHETAPF